MHNQGCVHSVQGRYGQGWLCGGDMGGWGVKVVLQRQGQPGKELAW